MPQTPDYVEVNRNSWNDAAAEYADSGARNWASTTPTWGIFSVPEDDLCLLPSDLEGSVVLENGCGTAYVSAWLEHRGATCIGLDNSPRQLATARRLQDEHHLHFPLIVGIAEHLPFADETFDMIISEYGACLWSDPHLWVPEAARVLKAGGELIFLSNSSFVTMFTFDDERIPADLVLKRDYFGMHRQEWADNDGVEFHLTHGDWFKRLHTSGFDVEDLIEIQPGAGSPTSYPWITTEWARRWPVEEVWKARKRAG